MYIIYIIYIYNIYIYIYIIYINMYIYIYCALWEEGDVEKLYLVLKVSCRWTDNLSARYNDHQKITV